MSSQLCAPSMCIGVRSSVCMCAPKCMWYLLMPVLYIIVQVAIMSECVEIFNQSTFLFY